MVLREGVGKENDALKGKGYFTLTQNPAACILNETGPALSTSGSRRTTTPSTP